jgi:hypothetical protein
MSLPGRNGEYARSRSCCFDGANSTQDLKQSEGGKTVGVDQRL